MKMLSEYYKEKFGCKVYKLSLDGGFSCPNRDGTLGTGGCIFCTGSAEFAEGGPDPIAVQLERAKKRVNRKNKDGKYMAYFQAFTNTYAPVEHLRKLYYEAIAPEEIVGLAILPQTVRPGADGQPNDVLRGNGFQVELTQPFHRSIGVGEGLEVGNELSFFYLCADPGLSPFQLEGDRIHSALCKFPTAEAGAEDTAPGSNGAIPVGAGKACIQGQLVDLAAVFFPVVFIQRPHVIPPFPTI